jgi:hypothetical protein
MKQTAKLFQHQFTAGLAEYIAQEKNSHRFQQTSE